MSYILVPVLFQDLLKGFGRLSCKCAFPVASLLGNCLLLYYSIALCSLDVSRKPQSVPQQEDWPPFLSQNTNLSQYSLKWIQRRIVILQ